jgi:RNA polymerase sigma-70 factor, ECF subfamily
MNFEKIYKQYKDKILKLTYYYIKDINEREELVQEIFYNIFLSLKNFKNKSLLSTYIFSIARNTCLNFVKNIIRERKRIEKIKKLAVVNFELNPFEAIVLKEDMKFFLSVIEKLPDSLREIFYLSEVEKLKYKEISDIKKIPLGTVKSRINRAKEKILELLSR